MAAQERFEGAERVSLLRLREGINRDREQLKVTRPPEVADSGDLAQTDLEATIRTGSIQSRADQLAAIYMIESGVVKSGICCECHEAIEAKRLMADSFAIRCRDCQEAYESRSQRRRRSRRV